MLARTMRQYATLPSAPTRGMMPPIVSVILPVERTNLVTNPSIELATTGYTAVGGSIARSAVAQYHGTYSLAVTPGAGTTDGAFYGTVALTSGQTYAYSCKFRGIPGIQYKLSIATTGGVDLSVTQFVASGRWQWISGYYTETSSTTRRIYFTKFNSANVGVFYVDGVQVEAINAGELVSTYIDGDQLGLIIGQQPPAYLWNGTPHASTSIRSALTRAGGTVVNLSLYNFILTGLVGLGMAVPNNIAVPYTVLDGARYLRTTKPPRTIALSGRVQADDYFSYQQSLSDLRQAFDRDLVPLQQPLLLQVEPQDECGTVIGDFATVPCIYAGGLEGDDGNVPIGDVAPAFTMYLPFIQGGSNGAALTVQQSVANANRILQRSPTGVWSAMGSGVTTVGGIVYDIKVGLDGKIYAAGNFTTIGGVANATGIAYWDGSAWNAMGTGLSGGAGLALAVAPNGDIIVGGSFTLAGGVANTVRIARWNGSTWNALSTGANAQVESLAFNPFGTLYVGGSFSTIGGVAVSFFAQWNGSAFSAVPGGAFNSSVTTIASDLSGNLYVGGQFTTINALTRNHVAKWTRSLSTWSALGTGTNNLSVNAVALGKNGQLFIGGDFTTANGVSANRIAMWNGTTFAPLGAGVDAPVDTLAVDNAGVLWVGGEFLTAGGFATVASLARWNGSTWLYPDVQLPATVVAIYAITPAANGQVFLGWDGTTGSATTGVITPVTNTSPSYVYPTLVIQGPSSGTSHIYQIINFTTGAAIYLNYTINAGETATFIFDPVNPSFTTSFRLANPTGDLSATILPGSQPTQFYLTPGQNNISFFAEAASVTATLHWRNRYNGLADLVN